MASDLYEIRFSGELTTDRQPPVSCPRCDATRGLTVVGRAGGPGRVRHCGRTFDFPRGWDARRALLDAIEIWGRQNHVR